MDPCPGSCGFNAKCRVVNHIPSCLCPNDFTGDPFISCVYKPSTRECFRLNYLKNQFTSDSINVKFYFFPIYCNSIEAIEIDSCNPSPCGPNAECYNGICSCKPEYHGDPRIECRPECVLNSDCAFDKACINNKCQNPCTGVCGQNAECKTYNHLPMCSCPPKTSGNAFISCSPVQGGNFVYIYSKYKLIIKLFPMVTNLDFFIYFVIDPIVYEPCKPSPCGPNSICRSMNNHATCSCVPGYTGSPPTCRPECTRSSDCHKNQVCTNQKCVDPCIGACGIQAVCQCINHSPICSCPEGFTGNPFIRCTANRKIFQKNYHLQIF